MVIDSLLWVCNGVIFLKRAKTTLIKMTKISCIILDGQICFILYSQKGSTNTLYSVQSRSTKFSSILGPDMLIPVTGHGFEPSYRQDCAFYGGGEVSCTDCTQKGESGYHTTYITEII